MAEGALEWAGHGERAYGGVGDATAMGTACVAGLVSEEQLERVKEMREG
jgi:hypothetical protein